MFILASPARAAERGRWAYHFLLHFYLLLLLNMVKILDSILEKWLPYKLPRLIMGLSIALSTGTAIPLECLQIVGIHLTQEQLSLARTTGIPWLLFLALALSHVLILNQIRNECTSRHREDIDKLLLAAIDVIKKRFDINNNIIYDFKDVYEKYNAFLPKHQDKLLSRISYNLHEINSLSKILSDEPVGMKRTKYVKEQRIILDRLEKFIPKIKQFRREIA